MLSSLFLRHRLMATSLFLFLLAACASRVPAHQETKNLAASPADLELIISGPREDVPDPPPREFHPRKFKMMLVNHSSHSVVYGPNAPEAVLRYESPDWRVTDPDGKPVPLRPLYICKVGALARFPTLAMTDENLFVIGPGESRDLGEVDISMWFKLSEPGEYKIYRGFAYSPPRLSQITNGGVKYPAQYDVSAMSPEKRQILRTAVGFNVKSNVWTLVIK
jgi:hypothetical protein